MQRRTRRAVYSRLGLIQVQRQYRRLYDDEEHLGDRRARNFLVAQTSHLYTDLYSGPCVQHTHTHTCTYTYICTHIYTPACVQIYVHVERVVCTVRSDTTSHGCMGPICIWTRARGDASSIISLGITPPSTRGSPSYVSSEFSARGLIDRPTSKKNSRSEIIKEPDDS